MSERILIIKLGSMGDVLRTTPLLRGLKNKFPLSEVSWLTYDDSALLLEGNRFIDRIHIFDLKDTLSLQAEEFDLIINLDKEPEALALTRLINAKSKFGFTMDSQGNIIAANRASEYSLRLGLDDELKFHRNTKTYPELIFEAAQLDYDRKYEYVFNLPERSLIFADEFFAKRQMNHSDVLIGINTGAGRRFANKNLSVDKLSKLVDLLRKRISAKIILLGGPLEIGINKRIKETVGFDVLDSGSLQIGDFAALVNRSNMVICADTLTLHIALALKKPVLALFGPTCHQEIELYGRGKKLVSSIACAPCYKNICDKHPHCMDFINLEEICISAANLLSSCSVPLLSLKE